MDIIQESYRRLFPEKDFTHQTNLEYNRRLGDFNANILVSAKKITIRMNLQWKDIDEEIKIGLIQDLLLKVWKKKKETTNTRLYHHFVKNIPILTPKVKSDPQLEDSFNRINKRFFTEEMEKPNLVWGRDSARKLACYNFHNDTITMSTIFTDAPENVLDYIMYHELLHKFHTFKHSNGRSSYHTKEFRRDEQKYPQWKSIEKEISQIIRRKKRGSRSKKSFGSKLIKRSEMSLLKFFKG